MDTIYEEMIQIDDYLLDKKKFRKRYYFKTTLEVIRTLSVFTIAIILIILIGYICSNFNMIEKFINKGTDTFTNFNNVINTYNPIVGGTLKHFNDIGNNFNKTLQYFNDYIMEEKLSQIFKEIEVLVNHADNDMNIIKNDSTLALKYLNNIQQEIKKLIG